MSGNSADTTIEEMEAEAVGETKLISACDPRLGELIKFLGLPPYVQSFTVKKVALTTGMCREKIEVTCTYYPVLQPEK